MPCKPGGALDIARTKRVPDVIELGRVIHGQVGCPAAVGFHEFDVHFSVERSFMHTSSRRSDNHVRLFSHGSSHFPGSGLYAVTTTAGDFCPEGIPQTHESAVRVHFVGEPDSIDLLGREGRLPPQRPYQLLRYYRGSSRCLPPTLRSRGERFALRDAPPVFGRAQELCSIPRPGVDVVYCSIKANRKKSRPSSRRKASGCRINASSGSISGYSSLRLMHSNTNGFLIASWEGDGRQGVPVPFWTTAGLKKGVRHCHPYPNKSFSRLLPKCRRALAVSWRPRAVRSR